MKDFLTNKTFLFLLSLTVLALLAWPVAAQIEDVSDFTGLKIKATALATATPLVEIYNQGNSQSLVVRDSGGTPEVVINANGAMTINSLNSPAMVATTVSGGGLTISGAAALNGGLTMDTTAFSVADTSGNTQIGGTLGVTGATTLSSLTVSTVTAPVIGASGSGQKCVYGTTTITGTGTIAHGLSTPAAVQLTLAEDVTGDGARTSYTNSAGTVTGKVWTSAATPAAASAGHSVAYHICGTP